LVGKEIFSRDLDPRSAERGQFHFVQSVIQEVAYSTLSKSARRAKHVACARWLAGLGEEELAGIVASHYVEAYRAEPSAADSEEIAGQAREWLLRAADRAFSLGSPEAAYGHAVQALSLAATPTERAALHATASKGAGLAGRHDMSWEHLVAASDGYQMLADAQAEGWLLATTSPRVFVGAERVELVRRLEDVHRRLDGASPAKVLVLAALADSSSYDGDHETALRWSELSVVLAQTLNDDEALSAAAGARAWALFNAERHFEAALLSHAVVALARRSRSAQTQVTATMRHGVLLATGEPRAAMNAFLESAAIAGRAGMRPAQGMGLANAAEAAIDLGELDVAARALAEFEELGLSNGQEQDAFSLSKALLSAYLGDGAAARVEGERLEVERRPEWGAVQLTTWYLRTRSAARLVDGDPAGALADAWESIGLEESGGNASTALWQGVQAAVRLHDPAAITSLVAATTGLRGAWIDAVRATAAAAATVLEGDNEAGAASMRAALDGWRELALPLDHALAAAAARHVLPGELVPNEDVDSARDYLQKLNADGLLRLFTPHSGTDDT
jgi:hypothetical protein